MIVVSNKRFKDGNTLDSGSVYDKTQKLTLDDVIDDLYYKPGDTFSPTAFSPYAAIVTSSKTTLISTIIVGKSLKNIKTITCTSVPSEIRGISGYLNSQSGYNEYVGVSGYTVSCYKLTNYSFGIRIVKSSAWTNVNNNTPVMIQFGNTASFTFN